MKGKGRLRRREKERENKKGGAVKRRQMDRGKVEGRRN